MMWTNDALADFHTHDEKKERWLESRPKCCICGEPIQEEQAVRFKDKWYCKEHEEELWNRVVRDDYLERIGE